ncbi:MAG: hypothetical protein K2L81_05790, partial [Muribaculaceae bacterium]|nr:hypothetical protein [Muribaculaceae bacterium]
MNKVKFLWLITVMSIGLTLNCNAYAKPKEVVYELTCSGRPDMRFDNLPCGVYVTTRCTIDNSQIYDSSELTAKMQKKVAKAITFHFKPDVSQFFNDSFKKYARNTGIGHGTDRSK